MINKIILIIATFLSTTLYAMTQKVAYSEDQVDDWEYNSTIQEDFITKKSKNMPRLKSAGMPSPVIMSAAPVMSESLGFAVGGAKDANNFYENIKNNYLPKVDSITYEGLFYDHYFETGEKRECLQLFCPSYSGAVVNNLYTGEKEFYLSVGLDSNIEKKDFKRKKLNIVVVLDISGSMGAKFNQYYYDKGKKISLEEEDLQDNKMQIANQSIVNMINHLGNDDRLGVVLFDSSAYLAKPLREINKTNIKATKKHILELRERGGTNWSAGYKKGIELFDSLDDNLKNPLIYENRIIFLTDAMPNRGELNKEGLFNLAKKASDENIYTSFIGIGVDFNNDLIEYITKTRGANYYAIHSAKEFKKRLDKEFDFMVTPLIFDLNLEFQSDGYEIVAVYGSPEANLATKTIMKVNTLFPSNSQEGEVKGGVILLKLKKISDSKKLDLKLSYETRESKIYKIRQEINFKDGIYYDHNGIRKAILLSQFGDLMKNWIIDMRKSCNDSVNYPPLHFHDLKPICTQYPPNRDDFKSIKTFERKSCPLEVSDGYRKIFSVFENHYEKESKILGDKSLLKEQKILEKLINTTTTRTSKKVVDDWQLDKRDR